MLSLSRNSGILGPIKSAAAKQPAVPSGGASGWASRVAPAIQSNAQRQAQATAQALPRAPAATQPVTGSAPPSGELSSAVVGRPGGGAAVDGMGRPTGQGFAAPTVGAGQAASMLGGKTPPNAQQPAQALPPGAPSAVASSRGPSRFGFGRKARPEQRQQQNDYMRAWGV